MRAVVRVGCVDLVIDLVYRIAGHARARLPLLRPGPPGGPQQQGPGAGGDAGGAQQPQQAQPAAQAPGTPGTPGTPLESQEQAQGGGASWLGAVPAAQWLGWLQASMPELGGRGSGAASVGGS